MVAFRRRDLVEIFSKLSRFRYRHSTPTLLFGTEKSKNLKIDPSGNIKHRSRGVQGGGPVVCLCHLQYTGYVLYSYVVWHWHPPSSVRKNRKIDLLPVCICPGGPGGPVVSCIFSPLVCLLIEVMMLPSNRGGINIYIYFPKIFAVVVVLTALCCFFFVVLQSKDEVLVFVEFDFNSFD